MVKIGREVPVASMDSSGKIIWAKHNEIQTVNIKSVGADFEVQSPYLKLPCFFAMVLGLFVSVELNVILLF